MSLLSNKNSNLSLSLLIFLLFSIQLFAQKTDIVTLLNGDKITGEVKYLRVGILTFKTDNMETVSIQWNKIQSIETQNYFEIEVADGRVRGAPAGRAVRGDVGGGDGFVRARDRVRRSRGDEARLSALRSGARACARHPALSALHGEDPDGRSGQPRLPCAALPAPRVRRAESAVVSAARIEAAPGDQQGGRGRGVRVRAGRG